MAGPRPRGQRPQPVVLRRLRPRRLKLPVVILFGRTPGLARNLRFCDWKREDPTASRYTCPPPDLSGHQTAPALLRPPHRNHLG